jgi:hypothetical protein
MWNILDTKEFCVNGGEIKRMEIPYILVRVFSMPMNEENLAEFVHFISNHGSSNSTIGKSKVTLVTDGHL